MTSVQMHLLHIILNCRSLNKVPHYCDFVIMNTCTGWRARVFSDAKSRGAHLRMAHSVRVNYCF
jgi:hypothetical protein